MTYTPIAKSSVPNPYKPSSIRLCGASLGLRIPEAYYQSWRSLIPVIRDKATLVKISL